MRHGRRFVPDFLAPTVGSWFAGALLRHNPAEKPFNAPAACAACARTKTSLQYTVSATNPFTQVPFHVCFVSRLFRFASVSFRVCYVSFHRRFTNEA